MSNQYNVLDIRLSDEHKEYKWCSYIEAKEYLKWEHSLIALEKLINKDYMISQ